MSLRRQVLSYGMVGVANTLLTALVITVLTLLGAHPVPANIAGYAAGLLNSFILNRRFTFRSEGGGARTPFLTSFGISYALNLAALLAAEPLSVIHALVRRRSE